MAAPTAPIPAKPVIASNNPLLNPNSTLSGNSLLQAAQGLAQAQTQPTITALAQQLAQNNQQAQGAINQVGGFYKTLGGQAQTGVNQAGQIGAGLNTQLGQIGQDEQNQLRQIGDNATASLLRYAPQSDANNSLAQPALQSLMQELARQQGLAAQSQGAFRSFGANQGANYQQLANSNLGTFGLRGQEALRSIAQGNQIRNAPLSQKMAQVQQAYGADLTTAVGKLRQQEVANTLARTGLGLKAQSNQITAQNNVAKNALAVRGQNVTIRGQNIGAQNNLANQNLRSQQIDATLRGQDLSHQDRQAALAEKQAIANAKKGAGAAKPLTPAQNNAMLTQLGSLQQLIASGQQHGLSEAQIRANLSDGANPSKRSYNPTLIEAAYELSGYGSINQSTAAALHNMGIRGGTFRNRPIKVTANFNPNNPRQNPPGVAQRTGGAINTAANAIGRVFGG